MRINTLYRALSFISDPEPKNFKWREAIYDALIVAGLNFSSTLAGVGATGVLETPVQALIAAGIAAMVGFFVTLATKRGLKPQ